MKYYKIVNPDGHHGLIYKEGLNTDINTFNPTGTCESGGIYFAREDILAFINYGSKLYEVEPDKRIYEENCYAVKFKSPAVTLKYIGELKDINVIKMLIDEGANAHANDNCVLAWAVKNNYIEITKLLIDNGANVNSCNVLHWTAYKGHFEMIKLLFDNGAVIHAYNDVALRSASKNGHTEIVKYLIDKGANVLTYNNEALRVATAYGHIEVVKLLLDNGADIHIWGETPLHIAALNGHIEVIKLLLDRGADIHVDDGGLYNAIMQGHTEIVKLLLDRGADLHEIADWILDTMELTDNTEMIKLIKEAKNQ